MRRSIVVFLVLLSVVLLFSAIATAKRARFTGPLGCKCHKPNMDDWEKSVHGKAFETLKKKGRSKQVKKALRKAGLDYKKDYTKDEKCVGCHVTGYDEPGGYVDEKSPEILRGVGCEMCHGAGSEYRIIHKEKGDTPGNLYTRAEIKAVGQKFPKDDESVCRQCHDHKDSPFKAELDKKYMFDYEEMIKLEKAWHKINKLQYKHD